VVLLLPLQLVVGLLRTHAPLRQRLQRRYTQILCDEFQDCNM